jgi:transcriptional regulator with XRE-family HTH domain
MPSRLRPLTGNRRPLAEPPLAALREQAGKTVSDVAVGLAVSNADVRRIERGTAMLQDVVAYLDVLGLELHIRPCARENTLRLKPDTA